MTDIAYDKTTDMIGYTETLTENGQTTTMVFGAQSMDDPKAATYDPKHNLLTSFEKITNAQGVVSVVLHKPGRGERMRNNARRVLIEQERMRPYVANAGCRSLCAVTHDDETPLLPGF